MSSSVNLGRVVGDSAYEVAVSQGYTGTESEWLASLQGQAGFSPVATVARTASDDGAVITITDNTGTTSAVVYDGAAVSSVSWSDIEGRPFDAVDVNSGLLVSDDDPTMLLIGDTIQRVGAPVHISGRDNEADYRDAYMRLIDTSSNETYIEPNRITFTNSTSASATLGVNAGGHLAWNGSTLALKSEIPAPDGTSITASNGVWSATFTESDPIFAASAAATITASDISAWNAIEGVPSASTVTDGYVLTTVSGEAVWDAVPMPAELSAISLHAEDIYTNDGLPEEPEDGQEYFDVHMYDSVIEGQDRHYDENEDDWLVDRNFVLGPDNGLFISNLDWDTDRRQQIAMYPNVDDSGYPGIWMEWTEGKDGCEGTLAIDEDGALTWNGDAVALANDIPSVNTLSAGTNITITTSSGVDTISATFTFTESDPVFAASAAATITASDISNWNALQGVPTFTASDDGKVLAVTTSGTALGWTTVSGGGVTVGSWEQDCLTISGSLTTVSNWDDWASEYANGHIYEYINSTETIIRSVYKYNGCVDYTSYINFLYTTITTLSDQNTITIRYDVNNHQISSVTTGTLLRIPNIGSNDTNKVLTVSSSSDKTVKWSSISQVPETNPLNNGYVLTTISGRPDWAAPATANTLSAGTGITVTTASSIDTIAVDTTDIATWFSEDKQISFTTSTTSDYSHLNPTSLVITDGTETAEVTAHGVDCNEIFTGLVTTEEIYAGQQEPANADPDDEYYCLELADSVVRGTDSKYDEEWVAIRAFELGTSGVEFNDIENGDSVLIDTDNGGSITMIHGRDGEFVWNRNAIQLLDQTSGDVYSLSIDNGQIVLTNMTQNEEM